MPSKKHAVNVSANINTVWNFIRLMNNWAPLVPGYVSHEIINEKVSTWEFKLDYGFIKKRVELEVIFQGWEENSMLSFSLLGLNERFKGEGYFKVKKLNPNKTRMIGYLEIHSTGTFPSMTNSLIQPKLEELTEELTVAVCKEINSL
ncbi:CoxG family protein [Bacillus sp. B1-b2]|uniref:CoxG family protein n=1 Tax=Bacillus sp. B1-b2 TaxID=2653201 RepID=UPI0012619A90|nr:SRPBCC family protein [Bacillus sp. B1-b2]KAB7671198.1 SRPBCC family protein [Bacillus sp. B1-b2]